MNHYIYAYLDPRKKGNYVYDEFEFEFEPFYIGISKNETRKDIHLEGAKKYLETGKIHIRYRNNRKIFKIAKILNDGYEPIIKILNSNLSEETAYKLEMEYITKIGRLRYEKGPLLNYLPGGQIVHGDLIAIQLRKNTELNQNKARQVFQYDLSNNLINSWKSVNEAEKKTGLGHIDACCRGERKTVGGFIWKYADGIIIKRVKKYKQRKTNNIKNKKFIIQYDMNRNPIHEFASVTEASEQTGISRRAISNMLCGYSKNAGGFIWKYKSQSN